MNTCKVFQLLYNLVVHIVVYVILHIKKTILGTRLYYVNI